MDYDLRRYQNQAAFSFPAYYYPERSSPLGVSHLSRPDPRTCPMGGPSAGVRTRAGMEREEGMAENTGNARRRIAVACARCRKRKIRCSGDPGNGSGCTNCKQAGVDMNLCQFHRVGSQDAAVALNAVVLSSIHNGLPNMGNPNAPIPIYNAGGAAFYNRTLSTAQYPPQIDTKTTVYPHTWTIPCSEDTSPVETYSLEQPAAYMSNPNAMTNVYNQNQNYRWNHTNQRAALQNSTNPYYEQDTSGMPFIQTSNIRAATAAEALSPLNMTSIQSALPLPLPERPRPRHAQTADTTVPQRQLPMPQPSPAQNTRNTVDLLQDQRLRSAQIMSGTPMNLNASFAKPAFPWSGDGSGSDNQSITSSEASSGEIATQSTTCAPVTNVTDSLLSYMPTTTSSSGEEAATSSAQPSLNFSTATLLDTMPAPATTATYSNFRNYALPTSTSADSLSVLARQLPQTNLYSFSPDSAAKRHSLSSSSNEGALVSGQKYTPLGPPPQAQHRPSMEGSRRGSFENRHGPLHRSSIKGLNHGY